MGSRSRLVFFLRSLVLPAAICCLFTVRAWASNIGISPVNIYLAEDAPSALLTLTNQDAAPVSFQISIYSWDQTDANNSQLGATSDVIVFPALVTLAPGEQRKIRIGATTHAGAIEKSYRLLLQELPPPRVKTPGAGLQIRFLSDISLPVFLEPLQSRVAIAITDETLHHGQFSFRVANTGSVHILPQSVTVTALDAGGRVVFSAQPRVWYLLAGKSTPVHATLSQSSCARVRSLWVTLQTETATVKQSMAVPSGACSR